MAVTLATRSDATCLVATIAEGPFVVLVTRCAQRISGKTLVPSLEPRAVSRIKLAVATVTVCLHVAPPAELFAIEGRDTGMIALDERNGMGHSDPVAGVTALLVVTGATRRLRKLRLRIYARKHR